MKKLLKQLSILALLIVSSIMTASPVALAQSSPNLSCGDIGDPEEEQGFIITITEESFGNEDRLEGDTQVLNCIRRTECKMEKITSDTDEETSEEKLVCKIQNAGGDPVLLSTTESCSPTGVAGQVGYVSCQRVQVFIATSGLGLLTAYLGAIYRWAAGIIGIVTVFYMIWGGIKIATAGDDSSAIDEAKKKIAQSIAGLVLLFLSAVILYTINPNFFTF